MPRIVYALVTSKGGSGKTTAAVHLAAALAGKRGARVVLIDGDMHTRAATGWAHRSSGRLPFEVRPAGAAYDDATAVVIDAAGGEAAADLRDLAALADRLIIPSVPSALDLLAALSTYRTLPEGTRAAVLLTRCPPATQADAAEARALLAGRGVPVLRAEVPQRKAYAVAALEGVTVREVRGGADLWSVWPRLLREVAA
jgi:chromosome partitioning protein